MARPRKRSAISQIRSALYAIARGLGDIQAAQKGTMGRRMRRRLVGKGAGRAMARTRWLR